ncbi:MAG TPA: alpha/beta fold hydrolase [Burkholderiaceae bacterium]|jgi:pimeloyl-ACP methyl ester carboxylesterase
MIARLLRWRLLLRVALACAALYFLPTPASLITAGLIFWGHGLVMLLSFASLLWINRSAPVSLLRALWYEFWLYEWVFGWSQPFAEQRLPDLLPAQHGGRGVLLLHGFGCNRGIWNGWLRRLRGQSVACVALSLKPIHGSIEDYVPSIEEAIQRLREATGQAPLIVAHSMGGLAARAWWRTYGEPERICGIVTLGSPHSGTIAAYLGSTTNVQQMRPSSAWLRALAESEITKPLPPALCYLSACDQIVCPTPTARLPGARAVDLPGTGHLSMIFHPQVWADVKQLL